MTTTGVSSESPPSTTDKDLTNITHSANNVSLTNATHSTNETYEMSILRLSSLVCKPEYAIKQSTVSFDPLKSYSGSDVHVALVNDAESMVLPEVSAWDIAVRVGATANMTSFSSPFVLTIDGKHLDTLFGLVHQQATHADISALLDYDVLYEASQQVYSSVAAQEARQFLLQPARRPMTGIAVFSERRLQIRVLSLRLTESVLGLLIIVVAILCVKTQPIVSCDPGSIGGFATILARSQEVTKLLKNTGAFSSNDLCRRLTGYRFQTVVCTRIGGFTFSIKVEPVFASNNQSGVINTTSPNMIRWWQPFVENISFRALILIVLVAMIVSLEVLLQRSTEFQGIADVTLEGYNRFTWVYVPTLTMVGIGMLFSAVDFSIKMFQPYHALQRGVASAEASILENQLARIGIHALWRALLKRQYAVFSTTLAMLLASGLTIAVSGLYTAETVPRRGSMSFRLRNDFNSTALAMDEYIDLTQGSELTNLIMNSNLSFPPWTHDELAFPELDLLSIERLDQRQRRPSDRTSVEIRIPAIRGAINCSVVPSNMYRTTTTINDTSPDYAMTRVWLQISNFCDGVYDGFFWYYEEGYFGDWLIPRSECPSLPIVYGKASQKSLKELTILLCATYAEQLEADTTLAFPDFAVDARRPPEPVESTAQRFMVSPLGRALYSVGSSRLSVATKETYGLNWFFSLLVHGKDGVPAAEMSGPANIERLVDAIQHLYRILLVQCFHSGRRISRTPEDAPILNGTFTDSTRLRLKQSPISTRIAQTLLGVMFICAAVAFWLMDTRCVLPKNPCSIAAVTSLLADAEFLRKDECVPEGSEWSSSIEELRRRGVFDGYMFSLGWWVREDAPGGRVFGIDVGRAEKAS